MKKIKYSPEARQDLQKLKKYIISEFGEETAQKVLIKITKSIRLLEIHVGMGMDIAEALSISCDYRCIFVEKNYVFYRMEGNHVKIIRILNEQQDFMKILFGINREIDGIDNYWDEVED